MDEPTETSRAAEGEEQRLDTAAAVAAHPQRRVVWTVVAAAICLGLAWPSLTAIVNWAWPPQRAILSEWIFVDAVRMGLVQIACGLWVFVIAATVGSFLNVVIHRLPQGRSVILGRSACPNCGHQVLARDNIPIIGWLRLGGRCRWCRTEISARYPVVEAACGGLLMALWCAELLSGGATLPIRTPNHYSGLVWTVLDPQWDLIAIYLYHAATLCMLLVWSLIAIDRKPIPVWHGLTVVAVMMALPAFVSQLHPVPLIYPPGLAAALPWSLPAGEWISRGLLVSLAGLAAGLVASGLVAVVSRWHVGQATARTALEPSAGMVWSLLLVGVVFGWQAVPMVCLLALALWSGARKAAESLGMSPQGMAPELCLLGGVFVHLLAWRWIVVAVAWLLPTGRW